MLVYDYIDVTQFDNYMFSYHIRCVLCLALWWVGVCGTVWSGFGGVSVEQVAL